MFLSSVPVAAMVKWLVEAPYMQAVNFIGNPDQIGQIVPCRLSEARQNSVTGDIVNLKGAA